MRLNILDTGVGSAEKNMQIDLGLLSDLNPQPHGLLHFYEWDGPSATYGYFNEPSTLLKTEGIIKHRLNIARRPTGGGIIFHQYDLAFSFLLSASHPYFSLNTLENYRFVNSAVAKAIYQVMHLDNPPELHSNVDCHCDQIPSGQFCMAKPTVYDLIIDGRKVAGAAQRRTKKGYLHQGSIALLLPPAYVLNDLLHASSGIAGAMQHSTHPLLGQEPKTSLHEARMQLKVGLIDSFRMAIETKGERL